MPFLLYYFNSYAICAVLSSPVPYNDERRELLVIFPIKQRDIHDFVPFLPGYDVHLSPINNTRCNALAPWTRFLHLKWIPGAHTGAVTSYSEVAYSGE